MDCAKGSGLALIGWMSFSRYWQDYGVVQVTRSVVIQSAVPAAGNPVVPDKHAPPQVGLH